MELQLTQIWLRKDTTRWAAGVLAGLVAGVAMLLFSMVLSALMGNEFWAPMKLPAVPFLGGAVMEYGIHPGSMLFGLAVHLVVAAFWGFVYAHFTGTNSLPALLGVGVSWGLFSWVFLANLMTQSFREIYAYGGSRGAALFACLVYGISLTSVAFFDRMLRSKKNSL